MDDLERITDIYNASIPGRAATADTEPLRAEQRTGWFNSHQPDRRPLWMITADTGETLGWCGLRDFYGRPAYAGTAELSLYLDPAHQGQGYGRQILAEVFARCPNLNIHTLLGFIFEHNRHSIKLFTEMGFESWGTLPDVAVMDGHPYTLVILGKKIEPAQR